MATGTIITDQSISKLTAYYTTDAIDTMLDGSALVALSSSVNASLFQALSDTHAYVIQIFYNKIASDSARLQIAYPYSTSKNIIAWRNYRNGTWSAWHVDNNDITDWQTFDKTGKTYNGTISYRKIGNVVYIKSDGHVSNITENFTFGYLPSGFRPATEQWFTIFAGYNVYAPAAYLRVYTSGAVQIGLSSSFTTSASTQFYFSVNFSI